MEQISSDSIYAVAVDFNPILWVVHCEICDEEFGNPTANDEELEDTENEHRKSHNLPLV